MTWDAELGKEIDMPDKMKQFLEDIDDVCRKHGQISTSPAELVRLVLEEKDLRIQCLERGLKPV